MSLNPFPKEEPIFADKRVGRKRYANFAVFGAGRLSFVIVRPPTRVYGYGELLNAYLYALRYARARGVPVYFLARRDDPGASLTALTGDTVRVLPPISSVRVLMWLLWGVRLGWAQLRSPGRRRRLQLATLRFANSFTKSCLDLHDRFQTRVHNALNSAWTTLAERLKGQKPEPLLLWQISGFPTKATPPVFARVHDRGEVRCRRLATSIGIDPDRPMVALHVRESGWRALHYKAGDRACDTVRNSSVETYRPAIRYLHKKGYQVVRLGDPSMSRLKAKGVIDLAHTPEINSLFELWIVSHSDFMIGTDSGPECLATLAGTPLLTVNAVHLTGWMKLPADRFICKLAYRPETRDLMTLAEMVAGGYMSCNLSPTIGHLEEPYRDNTHEEILEAVQEMLSLLSLPVADVRPTPAQVVYRELLAEHEDKLGYSLLMLGGQICDAFACRWLGVDLAAHMAHSHQEPGLSSARRKAGSAV